MIAEYPKLDHARNYLQSVVRQFELCYRLNHLDASENACFHFSIKQCHGACIGLEAPETYNERVDLALSQIDRRLKGNWILVDKGRTAEEVVLTCVLDGRYEGFGYFDASISQPTVEEILNQLIRPELEDPSARQIIYHWLESKKGIRNIQF